MRETKTSICRICPSYCPILVTVVDGRAVKVAGDFDAPLYEGYTCPKGRALPEQHNSASRLLHSMKRGADGVHRPIGSRQSLDEIATKLKEIIDRHGPESVALYFGTAIASFFAVTNVAQGFMKAIGSPMFFTPNTIDKPGANIAQAAHGAWQGGHPSFEQADAWLLIGLNPVISKSGGFPPNNPALRLKEAVARGMKLLVIDPRAVESTARAHIHLQARPGTDPAILAAMLHVILAEELYDADFIAENVAGVEALRSAVQPFNPAAVATTVDVPVDDLVETARVFAGSRYAGIGCGVGPSFALNGTLTDYLAACMMSICGFRSRAGDIVQKPHVLLPPYTAKAQAWGPVPYRGIGKKLRVRGLAGSAAGMPTAAAPEEILLKGEGQIRALICVSGNPMAAWPDQRRTFDALRSLDLLVTTAYEMTATAKLSHYVVAPKLTLETPADSKMLEQMRFSGPLRGIEGPYARYTPKIVDPPANADLIEDWELLYGLAKRMGLQLNVTTSFGLLSYAWLPPKTISLDMENKPSTDELLELLAEGSRIPLSEVKEHPHGALFDIQVRVQPRDPDWTARLDVGNAEMLAPLDPIAHAMRSNPAENPQRPFTLISRRINNLMNSCGMGIPSLRRGAQYNPAYLHPDDLDAIDADVGDVVRVMSAHGEIEAVLAADKTLRRGLVSMTHCFGGAPDEAIDPRIDGANVNALTSTTAEYDPITGMPRMGNLPVRLEMVAKS